MRGREKPVDGRRPVTSDVGARRRADGAATDARFYGEPGSRAHRRVSVGRLERSRRTVAPQAGVETRYQAFGYLVRRKPVRDAPYGASSRREQAARRGGARSDRARARRAAGRGSKSRRSRAGPTVGRDRPTARTRFFVVPPLRLHTQTVPRCHDFRSPRTFPRSLSGSVLRAIDRENDAFSNAKLLDNSKRWITRFVRR